MADRSKFFDAAGPNPGAGPDMGSAAGANTGAGANGADDDVIDADFKEV